MLDPICAMIKDQVRCFIWFIISALNLIIVYLNHRWRLRMDNSSQSRVLCYVFTCTYYKLNADLVITVCKGFSRANYGNMAFLVTIANHYVFWYLLGGDPDNRFARGFDTFWLLTNIVGGYIKYQCIILMHKNA